VLSDPTRAEASTATRSLCIEAPPEDRVGIIGA
jgi:hypothetical protein